MQEYKEIFGEGLHAAKEDCDAAEKIAGLSRSVMLTEDGRFLTTVKAFKNKGTAFAVLDHAVRTAHPAGSLLDLKAKKGSRTSRLLFLEDDVMDTRNVYIAGSAFLSTEGFSFLARMDEAFKNGMGRFIENGLTDGEKASDVAGSLFHGLLKQFRMLKPSLFRRKLPPEAGTVSYLLEKNEGTPEALTWFFKAALDCLPAKDGFINISDGKPGGIKTEVGTREGSRDIMLKAHFESETGCFCFRQKKAWMFAG